MNGPKKNILSSLKLLAIVTVAILLQACASSLFDTTDSTDSRGVFANSTDVLQDEYVLQSGDEIYIQVFNDPDLTMDATVAQSGSINYSYLGTIEVAGLSAEQLADSITEKLADGYLKDPSVNITVKSYRAFFIDGEINRPGSYPYEPGLTLAKAVSIAGGLTDRASRRSITLSRDVNGTKQSDRVELTQQIQPGDIINIGEGVF